MRGVKGLHPYKGELLTIDEISERSGFTVGQLFYRRKKYRCTFEEAAHRQTERSKRIEWNGRMLKYSEIAAETGLHPDTIRRRHEAGVPLKIAATCEVMSAQDRAMWMHKNNHEIDEFIAEGSWRDRCAKKICSEVGWNDPRKDSPRE